MSLATWVPRAVDTEDPREWMEPADVTHYKLRPSWIYQQIHTGGLPWRWYKVGKYVRWRRKDFETWLEGNQRKAEAK